MSKPEKPCDVKSARHLLPCLAPGDGECWGGQCWDKSEDKPRKTKYMTACPWLETVRDWWRKSRRTK